MVLATDALLHQIRLAGVVFRIRYYTETIGSVWDDERTITGSTSLYLSGIMEKIDATRGSEDEVLLEQGRIRYDDSKIFIAGSISRSKRTVPAETTSDNPKIDKLLKSASKKGSGKGRPEFLITFSGNSELLIVIFGK